MSELSVKGKIREFLEVQSGTSKASGNEWSKQSFIVTNNDGYEGREQIYCFEVFGAEKVENLTKYQNVGDEVIVKFSINTNEWKGKYFTSLSSYRIEKVSNDNVNDTPLVPNEPVDVSNDNEPDDLPF